MTDVAAAPTLGIMRSRSPSFMDRAIAEVFGLKSKGQGTVFKQFKNDIGVLLIKADQKVH